MKQKTQHEWEQILELCQRLSACLELDRLRQQTAHVGFELFDAEAALWVTGGYEEPRVAAVYPASRKEARSVLDARQVLRRGSGKVIFDRLPEPVLISPFTVESLLVCHLGEKEEDFLVIINPSPELEEGSLEALFKPVEKQLLLQRHLIDKFENAQKLALLDDLTGLYNARYFQEVLEREWKRSERYKSSFSLLFIDLDNFKSVNDRYGHLTGSAILQEVADVLRAGIRNADTLFRYGGDEFTVILPNCSEKDAQVVRDRIHQMITSHRFFGTDGKKIELSASVGISSYPADGEKISQLMEAADREMYRNKQRELTP
ncbi:MAG TPA: GGDEF domain-containing protein [Bdellovibrionota bacterium]|nr:GGDEF domain-containing protein [Bdellovibrionota bacterium]